MPVLEFKGRLWRAMEEITRAGLVAFMMSVPADADLPGAANWTFSYE
jgi:hypothetical protein